MKKIAFGFLWFVAIWFGSLILGSAIAGGIAGLKTSHTSSSPEEAFKKGQVVGEIAGAEFGRRYGLVIFFGALVIAAAGTISGTLPGTGDKIKPTNTIGASEQSPVSASYAKPLKLIGMLDSPYVRRTAISFRCMNLPFEHEALSVFSTFPEFQKINPVVKAPSLVFDDGEILMDSTLILEFAESICDTGKSLLPTELNNRKHALQTISFALASCEKAAQIIYEKNLRPVEKQHEPWLSRITGQLLAACDVLEIAIRKYENATVDINKSQSLITSAVAWQFIQSMLPDIVAAENYPALQRLSAKAETLPEFLAFPPDGPGVKIST